MSQSMSCGVRKWKVRRLDRLMVQASEDAQAMLAMLNRQQADTLDRLAMAGRLLQDMAEEHARLLDLLREIRGAKSLSAVRRKVRAYLDSVL